jgi:hypothetical protein
MMAVLVGVAASFDPGVTEAAQPTLTVQCTTGGQAGPCDESGAWQALAISVTWQANPVPTRVSGCDSQTYGETSTTVSCEVWWGPGGTAPNESISFPLNVDTATPAVSAIPARPPDANGWYNHPVAISYQGSAFSGIAGCTSPQTYAGPATTGVTLSGGCTDNAGKSASASLGLRYDATPPSLSVSASPGDQSATLHWKAETGLAPLTSLRVVRSPGLRGASPSLLSPTSAAGSYSDRRVRNRTSYRYTVVATDQAGNVSERTVVVKPGLRLLSPAQGAHVSTPPMLSWTPVPKATYYNVQIFRGGKVLSAWPKRAHLQLTRIWSFAGQRYHLRRGTYRWYVWPGFGQRSAARYGAPVGSGKFVVT